MLLPECSVDMKGGSLCTYGNFMLGLRKLSSRADSLHCKLCMFTDMVVEVTSGKDHAQMKLTK